MVRQLFAASLASAFLAAASGCLVVSGNSVEESGVRVSESTLGQIEVGTTTEAWLLASLGEPTDISDVAGHEGVKIYKYKHVVRKAKGGAVFLIYAGGSTDEKQSVAYFEVTDGIVTRYWVES